MEVLNSSKLPLVVIMFVNFKSDQRSPRMKFAIQKPHVQGKHFYLSYECCYFTMVLIFLRMLYRKTQFEDSVISGHRRNVVGRIRERFLLNLTSFCVPRSRLRTIQIKWQDVLQ